MRVEAVPFRTVRRAARLTLLVETTREILNVELFRDSVSVPTPIETLLFSSRVTQRALSV